MKLYEKVSNVAQCGALTADYRRQGQVSNLLRPASQGTAEESARWRLD